MRAVVAVLLFVTAAHAGLWGLFQQKQEAPDFRGILPSVSYAPFEGSAHPDVDNIPQIEKIRADLKKLSTMTRAIRLYSSTGGVELVPPIAAGGFCARRSANFRVSAFSSAAGTTRATRPHS